MTRIAEHIILHSEELSILDKWTRGRSIPARLVERAEIIQMAAEGVPNKEIARRLQVSRPTVQLWRDRFLAHRLDGLVKDAPRPGRIPKYRKEKLMP